MTLTRIVLTGLLAAATALAQTQLRVDFGAKLQVWDGFGVNYVEVPQTRDYKNNPQEYGGFSKLSEAQRQEIMDLFFGDDGLRPGVVKMFLDPWHEGATGDGNDNADPNVLDHSRFDHETTTKWMRYFVREGLKRTRARGGDLEIITTLYGPPAWMTKQKFMRGRDIDPAMRGELAEYLAAWLKYLRETEKFPVKYVSLHNEGEDSNRWPIDGESAGDPTHDYNAWWTPRQVVEFFKILRPMLNRHGLQAVGITPGEPTNWDRFFFWGYGPAIAEDPEALKILGLITSHGFTGGRDYWYSTHNPRGVQQLRMLRPELKAWTTSMTWGRMDIGLVEDLAGQVYGVGVNAAIPWAAVQTSDWVGGDPNPGTAVRVIESCKCYQVLPGYWFYKQVSRAGQPGMAVAPVYSSHGSVKLIGFSANGTKHPDAFVVTNNTWAPITARIAVPGTKARAFAGFRTEMTMKEKYAAIGDVAVRNSAIDYVLPPKSATTFFAR
jgi:O-glycosyl hydrolase